MIETSSKVIEDLSNFENHLLKDNVLSYRSLYLLSQNDDFNFFLTCLARLRFDLMRDLSDGWNQEISVEKRGVIKGLKLAEDYVMNTIKEIKDNEIFLKVEKEEQEEDRKREELEDIEKGNTIL